MNTIDEKLVAWLKNLIDFSLPSWESLPDLDLYMDQVVTYLERELTHLAVDEKEKTITTWMINNYVKDNLLPNSVKKKYTKEHLAYLLAISSIKQILSIPNIAILFGGRDDIKMDPKSLYSYFIKTQSLTLNNVTKETLETIDKNQTNDNKLYLYDTVFKLVVEAQVKKIIAEKILDFLAKDELFYKDEIERLTKEQLELQKIERERKNTIKK